MSDSGNAASPHPVRPRWMAQRDYQSLAAEKALGACRGNFCARVEKPDAATFKTFLQALAR